MAEEDGGPRGFSKKRSDVPESCATNRSYMMKQIISGGKNFIFKIFSGFTMVCIMLIHCFLLCCKLFSCMAGSNHCFH